MPSSTSPATRSRRRLTDEARSVRGGRKGRRAPNRDLELAQSEGREVIDARAGLAGGPDVWEVARVFRGVEARGEDAVVQTAELTGLAPAHVRTALSYYAEYREEIDDWIQRVDAEAVQAEATWRREQDLLRR